MIKRAAWIVTACMIAATPALAADPWPTRPVTVICPFPPGISTDILTRAVAVALSDALGQQFVMENRPGANGKYRRRRGGQGRARRLHIRRCDSRPDRGQQVHVQSHEL